MQVRDDLSQGEKDKNLKIKIQVEVREVLDSEKYLAGGSHLAGIFTRTSFGVRAQEGCKSRERTTEIFN